MVGVDAVPLMDDRLLAQRVGGCSGPFGAAFGAVGDEQRPVASAADLAAFARHDGGGLGRRETDALVDATSAAAAAAPGPRRSQMVVGGSFR